MYFNRHLYYCILVSFFLHILFITIISTNLNFHKKKTPLTELLTIKIDGIIENKKSVQIKKELKSTLKKQGLKNQDILALKKEESLEKNQNEKLKNDPDKSETKKKNTYQEKKEFENKKKSSLENNSNSTEKKKISNKFLKDGENDNDTAVKKKIEEENKENIFVLKQQLRSIIQKEAQRNYPYISKKKGEEGRVEALLYYNEEGNLLRIVIQDGTNASARLVKSFKKTIKNLPLTVKNIILNIGKEISIKVNYKL